MDAPVLDTPRLRLRPMRFADWPGYAAFMASPRSVDMGGPFDERAAWGMFCHDLGCWPLFGHGALMIEDRAGAVLGQVGISAGPLFPEPELGRLVHEAAEGRGVAFEAACALRAWAYGPRGLATLVSYIDPANARSRRLAERLGARLDPAARPQDPGDLVYRHPR
ncbi:MAG: GNAT family N-acetyltransferase [Albimonas sp.]|uniref:GNAT family N-acetyltransferase n=1 Tax=Albimonas sp. TaxID=1872425 RepID=UPI004056DBF3